MQRYAIEIRGLGNNHNRFKSYLSGFVYYEEVCIPKWIIITFIKGHPAYVYRMPFKNKYKLIVVSGYTHDKYRISDYSLHEAKEVKRYLDRIMKKKAYLHKVDSIKIYSVRIKKCKVLKSPRKVVISSK